MLGGRDSHRPAGLDVMREIDLAGNPLRETNIDAVNAQLKARGQEIIYGFHHEFSRLPSGDIVTLGWTQKTIDVGGTPTRYAGDMLLVLDQDLQVVWTWDAFDHLDQARAVEFVDDARVDAPAVAVLSSPDALRAREPNQGPNICYGSLPVVANGEPPLRDLRWHCASRLELTFTPQDWASAFACKAS